MPTIPSPSSSKASVGLSLDPKSLGVIYCSLVQVAGTVDADQVEGYSDEEKSAREETLTEAKDFLAEALGDEGGEARLHSLIHAVGQLCILAHQEFCKNPDCEGHSILDNNPFK